VMCCAGGWTYQTTVLLIWLQQLKLKVRANGLVIISQSVLHIVHFCISFVVHDVLGFGSTRVVT
jgi:hypothetical protein